MFLPGRLSISYIPSFDIYTELFRSGPTCDHLHGLSPRGGHPSNTINQFSPVCDTSRHILLIAYHWWTNRISPRSVHDRHPTDHPPGYSTSALPQLLRDLDHFIPLILPFVSIRWPGKPPSMLITIRLYTGIQSDPDPLWSVCATQAVLIYSVPVL